MRPNIDALTGLELGGPQMVEKNEGAHHLATLGGQHSADREAAQITLPAPNYLI
jgi:hypothetical protein